jgi:HPt (histidine-containing phosphotransfer) domain-containing protein
MCLAAGMDDYVSKPIRVEDLVAALTRSRALPASAEGATPHALQEQDSLSGDGAPAMTAPTEAGAGSEGDDRLDQAPATAPAVAPALDAALLERLRRTVGGDAAVVAELIDSFLDDAPQLLAALQQAVDQHDAPEVRRLAHSLKSNGADFGATTFAELCKQLEARGKASTLEGAAELVARLQVEYHRVQEELRAVREQEGRLPSPAAL